MDIKHVQASIADIKAFWFKLQNGVTPQEYLDKWSNKLLC